jgi:hypothetical protein
VLAACGGDGPGDAPGSDSRQAQPAAETAGTANDPCALVTRAEAAQVLDAEPEEERPSELNNDYLAGCRYVAPRGESVAVLAVKVSRQNGPIGFENARRMEELGIEIQPVTGVGDDAFWVDDEILAPAGTLYVLQDTVYLDIGGDVRLEQVRSLALRALERLR